MGGGGAVKVDARSVRRGSCEDLSVEGAARSEHRRARNLQIITGHGFWRSDSDAVPDATCNCARLATDGSRPASPAFEEGLSQRAGALPGGGMRDLPGFYWDEERQRYFALAQENVARDLSRCDPRRVSAHDEPAPIRADAFVFLSDANNRMASTSRDATGPISARTLPKTDAAAERARHPRGRETLPAMAVAARRNAGANARVNVGRTLRHGGTLPRLREAASPRLPNENRTKRGSDRGFPVKKTRHPRSTLCARARSGWRSAARTCAAAGSRARRISSPPRGARTSAV